MGFGSDGNNLLFICFSSTVPTHIEIKQYLYFYGYWLLRWLTEFLGNFNWSIHQLGILDLKWSDLNSTYITICTMQGTCSIRSIPFMFLLTILPELLMYRCWLQVNCFKGLNFPDTVLAISLLKYSYAHVTSNKFAGCCSCVNNEFPGPVVFANYVQRPFQRTKPKRAHNRWPEKLSLASNNQYVILKHYSTVHSCAINVSCNISM